MNGEFSIAVVQANNLLEDQSQIESGPLSLLESGPYGTFIGIYDGHGGPETSRFINDHLFQHLKSKKPKLRYNFSMRMLVNAKINIYSVSYVIKIENHENLCKSLQ